MLRIRSCIVGLLLVKESVILMRILVVQVVLIVIDIKLRSWFEMVQVQVKLSKEAHTFVKVFAVRQGLKVGEAVDALLLLYEKQLNEQGVKP